MCSSGLEALTCPLSTKFLRSTDLRFTTEPAIATYTLLGNRAFLRPCVGATILFGTFWLVPLD